MGSCSSVHRNSLCSKTVDKLVILPSPIKDKPKNDNFMIHDVALKSQLSPSQSTTTFNGRVILGLFLSSQLLIIMHHHHHHIKILFFY
jgi:hypothetical protein